MSTLPSTPTDEIWPNYQDVVDNWRAVDVHWLRDRVVHIFDDNNERSVSPGTIVGHEIPGMLSFLKNGTTDNPGGSLEYRRASGVWESVRYPNLTVVSDATTITMKRTGASPSTGIILKTDGSAEITKLFAGASLLGSTLDNTGISLKVGGRTVKLATDATQLTVDSPVSVLGDITTSTALKGASAALTGNLTAVNATLSGTLTVPTGTVSGLLNVGSLNATDAEVAMASALAVFRNKQSAANRLSFASTGDAILTGTTVTINGAITSTTKSFFNSGADLLQNVSRIIGAAGQGITPAPIAGVVSANRAPTSGDVYPDGTIWIQY